jgi:DNA-binding NarL/FixJ family response regulator
VSLAQLSHLLSTLRDLREEGRLLVAGIRQSVEEIRIQQARLKAVDEEERNQLQLQYRMTPREAEVARLLEEGRSNTAIAERLGISPHTARHHTQRVLAKLGVHSRSEAGARLRRADA